MRTLATVSIQWRAAVFSAFKPGGSCRAVEEIFLYVPDTGFHTAFFVWPSHVTSTWLEAVVCCKVQVARMKERPFSGSALDSQGLAVFFDTSQLEIIKVLIEQEVGRISSHGLGTMGMVSEPS